MASCHLSSFEVEEARLEADAKVCDATVGAKFGALPGLDELARPGGSFTTSSVAVGVPQKLSALGLTLNMILSIVGTTVLGIAAQMQKGGWFVGPALLLIGCAVIGEMTWLVSSTIAELERSRGITVKAYQDFARGAFGNVGHWLSSVTSTMALLGIICNGLVLISKNFQYAQPLTVGLPGCEHDCGRKAWALALTPVTVFYAFVEPGDLLKKSAAFGPAICVICILLAWYAAGTAVLERQEWPEPCMQDYWSYTPPVAGSMWEVLLSVASISSYGLYCFAVTVTVPALRGQMAEPQKMVIASLKAYIICVVCFLIIMAVGYYGVGNFGTDSIIDGMRKDRPVGWWATTRPFETGTGSFVGRFFAWSITINLLMTDAIYVPCTILAIEGWAPAFFNDPTRNRWPKIFVRLFVCVFRTFVANSVSQFLALTGLTSSLFCICNNVLIPVLAFYKVGARRVSLPRKFMHGIIFLFGCFVVICGTLSAFKDMLYPADKLHEAVGQLRHDLPAQCLAAYCDAVGAQADACGAAPRLIG